MSKLKIISLERSSICLKFILFAWFVGAQCGVIQKDVEEQGLYKKSDKVVILTKDNIDENLYGQNNAWFVQYYNSNCGHCRHLAPTFKKFAARVSRWHRVLKVGVLDCFDDDNSDVCRDFEIVLYPTMRFFHDRYTKANSHLGDQMKLDSMVTDDIIVSSLVAKIKDDQDKGLILNAPNLELNNYTSLNQALKDVPFNSKFTLLFFDSTDSMLGPILALDTSSYDEITVRLVNSVSRLSAQQGIHRFPSLYVVSGKDLIDITPEEADDTSILNAVNDFLIRNHLKVPKDEATSDDDNHYVPSNNTNTGDEVHLADIETALDMTLRHELAQKKFTNGEPLIALRKFINAIINYFPLTTNGYLFMRELKQKLASRDSIPGETIEAWIKELRKKYNPIFATALKFEQCLGSSPEYRGHPCGLWTMYHTLTVAAATKPGGSVPEVLSAMYGWAKYFFACTECSNNFQLMAAKNNMSSIMENDKGVLWLWIAHNEVNLRLRHDSTEDPKAPKIQYPRKDRCPECRHANGAWRLNAVYDYLLSIYNYESLRRQITHPLSSASPLDPSLSSVDLTITGAL